MKERPKLWYGLPEDLANTIVEECPGLSDDDKIAIISSEGTEAQDDLVQKYYESISDDKLYSWVDLWIRRHKQDLSELTALKTVISS